MTPTTRRTFLRTLAIAAAGTSFNPRRTSAANAPPPREGGLASEGLLAGQPGFHARTAAPLPYAELPGFLSRAQLSAHHAEYAQSVEALKSAEQALSSAPRDVGAVAAYRALRHEQVSSANSVLLHDFYFGGLSPSKIQVPSYVQRHMNEHMGSMDSWAADFKLCALAAQTWAALIYDPYDDRWHNVVMDSDVDGVWVGGNPLLVCDVAPHAYSTDYHSREEYVAKFIDHIDWNAVAQRYHRVDRM